jgi:hypothetical protein
MVAAAGPAEMTVQITVAGAREHLGSVLTR